MADPVKPNSKFPDDEFGPNTKNITSHDHNSDEEPDRPQYIVAQHVAILDEHVMTPGSDDPKEYCGPNELQQIADNNNRRVEQTGDATPIVIGHTTDGKDENKQPTVVGFATSFSVGPLFDTGRMGLFCDFHIKKDKVEEVNNYPRRSVELWSKRWEVDPISLLGATTPERDLGLLQLRRKQNNGERPIRYSRVYNGPERVIRYMATSTGSERYAESEKEPEEEAVDTIQHIDGKWYNIDHNRRIVSGPHDTGDDALAPIGDPEGLSNEQYEELMNPRLKGQPLPGEESDSPHIVQTAHEHTKSKHTYFQRRRYAMAESDKKSKEVSDRSEGAPTESKSPDETTAKIVAAVMQSAPMVQLQEQMQEILSALQGEEQGGEHAMPGGEGMEGEGAEGMDGGAGGPGGEQQEARWEHEGAPIHYNEEHEYDDGEQGQGHYTCNDPAHKQMARQYAAEGGFGMASGSNTFAPTNGNGKKRFSRVETNGQQSNNDYDQYTRQLVEGDQNVDNARLQSKVRELEAKVLVLTQDKVRYARGERLRALQAEGITLDVAEEVADSIALPEQEFEKRVERIKKRYQRDPSGMQPIRIAESGNGANISPESRMNHEERLQYSRAISERALSLKGLNPAMPVDRLIEMAKAELAQSTQNNGVVRVG